jgi:predicted Fe-Mo cluster-binding NifX family protein
MKKIAFPTEDGETISRHLGRAQLFLVAILEDSGAVHFEKREKPYHSDEMAGGLHEHTGFGMGPSMFAPISDCQVLISGGMGEPAFKHAREQGLEVILPAEKNIHVALEAYRNGKLESDLRRIHKR